MRKGERKRKKKALRASSIRVLLLSLGLGELLIEAIDTSVLGNETLLAGVEGVAIAAGVDLDFGKGGAGLEGGTAGGAGNGGLVVLWMDSVFHLFISFRRMAIRHTESVNTILESRL